MSDVCLFIYSSIMQKYWTDFSETAQKLPAYLGVTLAYFRFDIFLDFNMAVLLVTTLHVRTTK